MLAFGSAVFAAESQATAATLSQPGSELSLPDGPEPWWLLHPLQRGDSLPRGWRVGALSRVERGASVLELVRNETETVRVHLCFRVGEPKGLAYTQMFDLLLMDGGNGQQPTEEGLARVLKDIARRIATNELRSEGDLKPLARMMSHDERVEAYGPETLI